MHAKKYTVYEAYDFTSCAVVIYQKKMETDLGTAQETQGVDERVDDNVDKMEIIAEPHDEVGVFEQEHTEETSEVSTHIACAGYCLSTAFVLVAGQIRQFRRRHVQ